MDNAKERVEIVLAAPPLGLFFFAAYSVIYYFNYCLFYYIELICLFDEFVFAAATNCTSSTI
jgi:hypothetical protein